MTVALQGEHKVEPWQRLFAVPKPGEKSRTVRMRVLRRNGQMFLCLPRGNKLAAQSLDLYAAQTAKARRAKAFLGAALRIGFAPGLETVIVCISTEDSFYKYLQQVASADEPSFAILCGNPNTPGQRFIFLLFDARGRPAAVVKAGVTAEAIGLIEREESFLNKVPRGLSGIPSLISSFTSANVRALATDFFPGKSPDARDWKMASRLLNDWVNSTRTVAVYEMSIWGRLVNSAGASLSPAARELGAALVSPTVLHGDFAPWNIKVRQGNWIAVDWERGELIGMPLWDWLHFTIQPMILVEKAAPAAILLKLAEFFQSAEFGHYARQARIKDVQWQLTHAYLDYCLYVLKQSEGLEQVRDLAEHLRSLFSRPSLPS
jgi:hypothetical protein